MWASISVALVAMSGGCSGDRDAITIPLAEVNGSGVAGQIRLEPAGERTTRMMVAVEGGEITGARIMHADDDCSDGVDDKYPIQPPSGLLQVPFEQFRRWEDAGGLAAAALRRGCYVACVRPRTHL